MAVDLTVILENRPGTLADMGEALGKAGLSINGVCGFPCEGKGVLHILVDDANVARRALEGAGLDVQGERQVLVLGVENRPGQLGDVCRRIANAGANVDLVYVAANNLLVIGADDLDKARAAV
ncbi:MAG: amino acid-binding protein [Dehalococcoidia bacterium]